MNEEHHHKWQIPALPEDGVYAARCACGAVRTFPMLDLGGRFAWGYKGKANTNMRGADRRSERARVRGW